MSQFAAVALGVGTLSSGLAGCRASSQASGVPDKIWGRRGIIAGRFQKPRAIAIDPQDRLYIVDMTARIQVFDSEGNFLHAWQTPDHQSGRPQGLTIAPDGKVLVADTHYFQILTYTAQGELLESETIGGTFGQGAGELGLVTDAVRDSLGNCYVSQYGFDCIQKFSPAGEFVLQWGGLGEEPGMFRRPRSLSLDEEGHLWVVDACNHRIQIFDDQGTLLNMWGEEGSRPGNLYYPYDLAFGDDGHVYVCEFGNHRIQEFTRDGRSVDCWGSFGRGPGELNNPWSLASDSLNRIHVLDTNNHRVQRIVM